MAHDKLLRGRKTVVTYAHHAPLDSTAGKSRRAMMEIGRPTTLSLLKSGPSRPLGYVHSHFYKGIWVEQCLLPVPGLPRKLLKWRQSCASYKTPQKPHQKILDFFIPLCLINPKLNRSHNLHNKTWNWNGHKVLGLFRQMSRHLHCLNSELHLRWLLPRSHLRLQSSQINLRSSYLVWRSNQKTKTSQQV